MVFHWRLSDRKSQVSRTLLSILAVLNSAVVWMVFTRPPTSKSSSLFNNPLVTVPKALITIGTIVTFMFHSFFFQFSSKVEVLIFLFTFFHFYSVVSRDCKVHNFAIFFWWGVIIIRSGLLVEISSSCCCYYCYHYYYYNTSCTRPRVAVVSLFKWEKKKKMHVSNMFNFPILVDTQYFW